MPVVTVRAGQNGVQVVMTDIIGTLIKTGFIAKVLYPYVRKNCAEFCETHWRSEGFQETLDEIRKRSQHDRARVDSSTPVIAPKDARRSEIIESFVEYVNYILPRRERDFGAFQQFKMDIW